ncbi:MAG: DUF333 domain-containing protein [Gammaproteobacteria bacterium]|nr:DUF333 domain-containing protein [Gammaproteobacteria bacterium]
MKQHKPNIFARISLGIAGCILAPTVTLAATGALAAYCVDKGGTVTRMTAWFSTLKGPVAGMTKRFCTFKRDHGSIAIGLSTFSSEHPSIAATYMKKLSPLGEDSKLMEKGPGNPSYSVCKNLGGTAIGFGFTGNFKPKDGGDSDICVFGDGSMVSAWSLIYMANHRDGYDEVKDSVRSEPLNVTVP